jgi:predicted PurR-regulated permease PerM
MNYKKLQVFSFLSILLVAFIVVVFLFKPFLNIMALGIIATILFYPVYSYFLRKIKNSTWSAFLTVLVVVFIFLIPLALFGQLLFSEILDVYHKFRDGALVLNRADLIQSLPPQIQDLVESLSRDFNSLVAKFSANAFAAFSSLVSNVASFFVSLFLLLFTIFYLLRDGEKITKVLMDISPINDDQEHALIERVIIAINGVVKGSFLIALVQGFIATIGLFLFGVPNPLLWGFFTVMAALVPNVGTSLSLIPAIIYLFITGHTGSAIGLLIWSALAVGLIDNVLGPKLIGSKARVHPLLVLFGVLGGIQFFGMIGFLLGPILVAVFVALVDMYRTDFKDYLEQ